MKVLIILAAVVACVSAKAFKDLWHSLSATDGQFVVTLDTSLEHGRLQEDWSVEFVYPYKLGSIPRFLKAPGTGHPHYSVSSEEWRYLAQYQGTKGFPHTARLKALGDALSKGDVVHELSDEELMYHLNPITASKYAGSQYFMDHSGDVYYRPATQGTHQAGDLGVQVARKK